MKYSVGMVFFIFTTYIVMNPCFSMENTKNSAYESIQNNFSYEGWKVLTKKDVEDRLKTSFKQTQLDYDTLVKLYTNNNFPPKFIGCKEKEWFFILSSNNEFYMPPYKIRESDGKLDTTLSTYKQEIMDGISKISKPGYAELQQIQKDIEGFYENYDIGDHDLIPLNTKNFPKDKWVFLDGDNKSGERVFAKYAPYIFETKLSKACANISNVNKADYVFLYMTNPRFNGGQRIGVTALRNDASIDTITGSARPKSFEDFNKDEKIVVQDFIDDMKKQGFIK